MAATDLEKVVIFENNKERQSIHFWRVEKVIRAYTNIPGVPGGVVSKFAGLLVEEKLKSNWFGLNKYVVGSKQTPGHIVFIGEKCFWVDHEGSFAIDASEAIEVFMDHRDCTDVLDALADIEYRNQAINTYSVNSVNTISVEKDDFHNG